MTSLPSTIEERYTKFQEDTSWYVHAGQRNAGELVYLVLGLVGEAGEFADAVKKIIRETGLVDEEAYAKVMAREGVTTKLMDELGDTFWYLNKLLTFLEANQQDLMLTNTLKLYSRLMARPHSNLTELEWPFITPYHDVADAYNIMVDKNKDGV